MFLVIDNYDSFTYNLVQYLGELSKDHKIATEIIVKRNDEINLTEIRELNPKGILLSPGPGNPDQSGICLPIIKQISIHIPTLGVCLGHQALAQVYGGKVIVANELMHGKTSKIYHNKKGIFKDIESPFIATRYHSLIVDLFSLPSCFEVTAYLEDSTVMALAHKKYKHIFGVQFHPESVLTQFGHKLISNFLKIAEEM
ncbi:MAG: aminodeoxychorismate/anthranilate synthase component II [Prochlorococcus sp. SP3034]|nr:aminodeoxychorismate/anthranilate synthase component II [Prochlorococcus sp. SP3034]|tara:strand:+ start:721 stop:1317 length:597 start_codon:yes stop_codon:yes gene_type:complete